MELVDRYLYAVGRYLPTAKRADIIRELSDELHSQLEEQESNLGRPLTPAEQGELLKRYGAPLLVASRYQAPQSLVGPNLLPYYWQTLRIVLIIVWALELVGFGLAITSGAGVNFGAIWGTFWMTLAFVVGTITIIFAIIERVPSAQRFEDKWDPRSLPVPADPLSVSRATSIAELTVNVIFLAWLLNVRGVREAVGYAMLGPISKSISFAFAVTLWWHQLLIVLGLVATIDLILNVVNIVRPNWYRLRAATLMVTNGFMLVFLLIGLLQHQYVLALPPSHGTDVQTLQVVNAMLSIAIIIVAAICAFVAFLNVRKLFVKPDGLLLKTSRAF